MLFFARRVGFCTRFPLHEPRHERAPCSWGRKYFSKTKTAPPSAGGRGGAAGARGCRRARCARGGRERPLLPPPRAARRRRSAAACLREGAHGARDLPHRGPGPQPGRREPPAALRCRCCRGLRVAEVAPGPARPRRAAAAHAMSFGHERLSRLLAQPDIAYDDRLSACKALADVASHADNALRIATSAELTQSMSNILNVSRSPDIDRRHQAQVCLAITRCVAAGGKDVSLAFSKSPGLVEGLCKLKRDPEAFVQVSAICALRLLGRCDEACGVNRRLLRAKWQNVLDADQTTGPSQRSPASQHPARPAHASQEQPGHPSCACVSLCVVWTPSRLSFACCVPSCPAAAAPLRPHAQFRCA